MILYIHTARYELKQSGYPLVQEGDVATDGSLKLLPSARHPACLPFVVRGMTNVCPSAASIFVFSLSLPPQHVASLEAVVLIAAICARFDLALAPGQVRGPRVSWCTKGHRLAVSRCGGHRVHFSSPLSFVVCFSCGFFVDGFPLVGEDRCNLKNYPPRAIHFLLKLRRCKPSHPVKILRRLHRAYLDRLILRKKS